VFFTVCICEYTHNYIHCIIELIQRVTHLKSTSEVSKLTVQTYVYKLSFNERNLILKTKKLFKNLKDTLKFTDVFNLETEETKKIVSLWNAESDSSLFHG
jgi:REP element-mobilizing transposase RayT